ncbi:DUF389 domain-containing protein [Nostoc spongiaeforme FACHB-130]|uniref:DUF389 domain-containing protein n=1 Tax=Nostoc spongiaeforme FACHB-130 TaxID=1357510 RepID=A0ABR8G012_9NOSO|nr:DUF389 domain-containing protein [Nostoc spongiaeforme]MBD2596547.1 DUF389 domain-containing protein [Nostoc spongiaeforme FACHB-130]
MGKFRQTNTPKFDSVNRFRNWLTINLGISQVRKEEIYRDLLISVTLKDVSYWLQVIFAAGIATLGLVLNSPAVIIGAMLISPLMGTILATGLAFATGDIILAVRAILNLSLSCIVAIAFAIILVAILPFKELTAEILARTRPNSLDLVIALFSGALGSVATSKEPKGVVTSIPGVSIAVALMPPLCVVGYGIGIAATLNLTDGLQIARGGGLLFLTNLTAITLMAMIVFLLLHIDTPPVRQQVRKWHEEDPESHWFQSLIQNSPISNRLEVIGSLPSRFILILFPVLVLLIPLSQSLTQLRQEISQKQQNNQITKIGTELWREKFANFIDGQPRSDISKFFAQEQNQKLLIQMRVFTSKLYTPEEKNEFARLIASRLNKNPDAVQLQLIEIPTASKDIITQLAAADKPELPPEEKPQPTIAEYQAAFLQSTEAALQNLQLPSPAELLRYELIMTNNPVEPLSLNVVYLSQREISPDAKSLLVDDVRNRLSLLNANIKFQRIPVLQGSLNFAPDQAALTPANTQLLDRIGRILKLQRNLQLDIRADLAKKELTDITQKRIEAMQKYLNSQLQIPDNQITLSEGTTESNRSFLLKIKLIDKSQTPLSSY